MSHTPQSAARTAIDAFKQELESAKAAHATLIAELEADLIGVSWEMSDSYAQFTDDLSASLGAQAANECDVESDQEDAIAACESFVSDEISCDAMSLVAASVVVHGPTKASDLIGKMVSESPVRSSIDASP